MTTLQDLLRAAAEELGAVEVRSFAIHEEADIRTALELLPEWSAFLELGTDCTDGLPQTTPEQRYAAFRKLVLPGGQNRFHFVQVAQGLGYEIEIEDIHEFHPFCAGSCAGAKLTNGAWLFVAEVHAPEVTARFARAGETVAGEPLVSFGNELLECTLDRIKPAHVLFLYVYDLPFTGYAPWSFLVPAPLVLPLVLPFPSVNP